MTVGCVELAVKANYSIHLLAMPEVKILSGNTGPERSNALSENQRYAVKHLACYDKFPMSQYNGVPDGITS